VQHEDTLITEADQRRLQHYLSEDAAIRKLDIPRHALLHALLHRASIVRPKQIPSNVITMNSLVVLRDLESGDRLTCRLAYPREAGQSLQNVSVSQPLGAAILGKRVGQTIRWPIGARDRRMRIQQVIYQPEAAGDFHL
jgi:regulator of nucleoside diphosphate kinase